jgi:2-aminoethylphosphonate-pyruvate transaminase
MKKYLLFTPGPVNVSKSVKMAMIKEDICHRDSEFDLLLQSVEQKLLELFEIQNDIDYNAVIITGSGTAANEAMLSSIVGDKNILILSNGEFGDRLFDMSMIHNKHTYILKSPWGECFDLNKVECFLKNKQIDIVCMVHHETSSGMINSLEAMGSLVNKHGGMFVVDCVSSAGSEVIDMKKNHISFFSGSSSKAIGSYPGLSFVIGETAEFEKLKDLAVKSSYLNLYKFYHFAKTISQTPNTPAVHLFYALEQALANILHYGVTAHYNLLQERANMLREGMKNWV